MNDKRYTIVDNVDGQPSGYELVDTHQTPHCTFACGLMECDAVRIRNQLNAQYEALKAAYDHLEYTGWGDNWERECARASGLEEQMLAALGVCP